MVDSDNKKFTKLPFGKIKPEGWLKRQLKLQAEGLTGHLDEVFEDVSKKSAWLGGNGEAWEIGPYYLDGLVTLAYLLQDEKLINKSNEWIGRILSSASADGFFGPKRNDDWWPRTIALNALITYAEATGDRQILPFIKNYFICQYNQIDEKPLYMWASARAFEELIPLKYLYDKTGDILITELVKKLKIYSYDWFKYYKKFKYKRFASSYLNKNIVNAVRKSEEKKHNPKKRDSVKSMKRGAILRINKLPAIKKMMLTHGVNNAMAVKYPVLYNQFFPTEGFEELSKKAIQNLLKYHGTAVGVFTSDEHLNGVSPSQGIELCTVVEFMRSLEFLLEKTGDTYYADLLELVAFNALPAAVTADFTAHQFVQQVNQISATNAKRDFFNVKADGNIYGVAPNHGCCAANLHQGFPRFVESLCLKFENELAFYVYAPCSIETEIDGTIIKLTETTDYPFKNDVKITVDTVSGNPEVKLSFRIPQYTSVVISLNGKEIATGNKGVITIKRCISLNDEFVLKFDTPLTVVTNPDKSYSIRRGSLLMATKLKTKHNVIGKPPFCDNEYYTKTQWRTAPEIRKKTLAVNKVTETAVPDMPFDESCPPIEIEYFARYVLNWNDYKNSADSVPRKPKLSEELFSRTLVPYGCTRIRIAQHPHLWR